MIVHVHADGSLTLDDPDTFTAFSVRAEGLDAAAIAAAFGSDGEMRDDEHVWISIERLHALGAAHGGEDWRAGCDGMIAFAKSKGWVDEARGLVRAHVEGRVPPR